MPASRIITRLIQLLTVWLIVQTTVAIVLVYRDYFPPNFRSDFLWGREGYFGGVYAVAFYTHILSGPMALLSGLVLLSDWFRRRWPRAHRYLGRFHVCTVLLLVAPGGLYMARFAMSGAVAAVGFASLALCTGICAALGWRKAVARDFASHRVWMQRLFVLLASAVVLRLIGGLAEVCALEGTYPVAAWVSWLGPLAALEWWRAIDRRQESRAHVR